MSATAAQLSEELMIDALKRAGSKARAIAVAVHDFQSGLRFSLRGDRWFHAASTIKVAVLLAIFRAGDEVCAWLPACVRAFRR